MEYLEVQYEETKKTYVDDPKHPRKNLNHTYLYLQGLSQGYTKNYINLANRMTSSSLET